ncbi:MAG TPA: glucosyl-3-phosphoglycerate synthase [Acidimicrobiales bacterium]|jgi:glucosyl-3-phosphoglycerate synthase|nr:glucosyl-3-phosphoglycerate synthase [Acidimicrobiales bacterium]
MQSRDYPAGRVAAAKGGRSVSVCLPARDEEETVGEIVARITELEGVVDEIVVVDDGSTDATAERAAAAGAVVVRSAGRGKGDALWRSVLASKGDVLAFCDADLRHFDNRFVLGLVGPLLADGRLGFVKASYARPHGGGRVTELLARPLIDLLLPEVARFDQPLAGEFAGRRHVLEALPFVEGYGVDLGLLVDAVRLLGHDGVAQVDLGERHHRNRPLAELAPQAREVAAVALDRAGVELAGGPPRQRPPVSSLGR